MDLSTILWVAWVAAFFLLELIGLQSPDDKAYTFTNRIRALMRSPARHVVRAGLGLGLLWLIHHFLVVDPVKHPGA